MIQREIKFSFQDKTFAAKFPNVGQMIDMESLKQALTRGKYGQMAQSGVAYAYYALDLVDAIAFFQVCVPAVSKFFEIKDYTELDLKIAEELVRAYRDEIKPWYDTTLRDIRNVAPIEEGNDEGKTE